MTVTQCTETLSALFDPVQETQSCTIKWVSLLLQVQISWFFSVPSDKYQDLSLNYDTAASV
jgi:hypothetical protein